MESIDVVPRLAGEFLKGQVAFADVLGDTFVQERVPTTYYRIVPELVRASLADQLNRQTKIAIV